MRKQIVDRISQGASLELAGRAQQLVSSRGNLMVELVGAGFAPAAVLEACAAAVGLEAAPVAWLRNPAPPPHTLDPVVCRQVQAAPVALHDGALCIAYANPETAARRNTLGFPPHRAFLAMPAHLEKALSLLSPGASSGPASVSLDDLPLPAPVESSGPRPKLTPGIAPALSARRAGAPMAAPPASPSATPREHSMPGRPAAPRTHSGPSIPAYQAPEPAMQDGGDSTAEVALAFPSPAPAVAPPRAAPSPPAPERSTSGPRPRLQSLDPDVAPGGAVKPQTSAKIAKAPAPAQSAPAKEPRARTQFSSPTADDSAGARSGLPVFQIGIVVVCVVLLVVLGVRSAMAPAPPPPEAPSEALVASRQNDLVLRASNMRDQKKAIGLLDNAIKMNAASRGARVALLERLRIQIALSDFDAARADLAILEARPDAAEIAPLLKEYREKIARIEAAKAALAK